MLDGVKVTILKNSLKRMTERRNHFLFPIEKAIPYILHTENRVSNTLVTICLLEGIHHRTTGVNTKACFTEIESVVNNSILSIENGNWKLPVNRDIQSPVSLCSTSAHKFGGKIVMLFNIIFLHHSDNNLRRHEFYVCVVTLYQDIMKNRGIYQTYLMTKSIICNK